MKPNKKYQYSALALVLLLAGWSFVSLEQDDSRSEQQAQTMPGAREQSREPTESKQRTLGSEWRWDNFPKESKEAEAAQTERAGEPELIFDVPYIYDKLQAVRLDEQGDIIADSEALKALNEAIAYADLDLNPAQLEELKELIRIGLPGSAGEQTAKLVEDFYHYSQAEKEFHELYATPGAEQDIRGGYEELVALRELYLGPEVAASLFAEEDQAARYMLESMLLERDESLSDEERLTKQTELAKRFQQHEPAIRDWQTRYPLFAQERDAILASSLSEEQKTAQLDALLSQHFEADEVPTVQEFLDEQ